MKKIYKYAIERAVNEFGAYVIDIHKHARIINAIIIDGMIIIYAEVDTEQKFVQRQIVIVGTGHEVPETLTYITTITRNGFVWHIYA